MKALNEADILEKSTGRANVSAKLQCEAIEGAYSQSGATAKVKVSQERFRDFIDFNKLDNDGNRELTKEEIRYSLAKGNFTSKEEEHAVEILGKHFELISKLDYRDVEGTNGINAYEIDLVSDLNSEFDRERFVDTLNIAGGVGMAVGAIATISGLVALSTTSLGLILIKTFVSSAAVTGTNVPLMVFALGTGVGGVAGYGITEQTLRLGWETFEKPSRQKLLAEFA